MDEISLLKRLVEVQSELIEVMDRNLKPCFSQDDIDAIRSLEYKIEQLKQDYENKSDVNEDEEILLG